MKGEFYSSEADLSSPRKEVLGESEEEREGRGGRRWKPRFLFRGRGPGVFFPEEGRIFPFASSKGFVFLSVSSKGSDHSCFPCGYPTFLCVPRRDPGVFFPEEGREPIFQSDSSKVFVFFSVRREPNFSFMEWTFPNSKGAPFPRATTLETSPGRTSEIEGIQLPGSSRSPVDQRFFRKRTDSCFPLFLFSSNRSNLFLVS